MYYRKYSEVGRLYPVHLSHFLAMMDRAKAVGSDFTRDLSGLMEFVEYVGPVPSSMVRPSIGRSDHSIGYVRGNFGWQEHSENMKEVWNRVKPWTVQMTGVKWRTKKAPLEPELRSDWFRVLASKRVNPGRRIRASNALVST